MRLLSGILLTVLILVNLFGFYALFICRRADIKKEMAEKIAGNSSTPDQQVLSFEKEAFSKLPFDDNGKEFQFEGKLYDVVSVERSGKQVKVTVEYDSEETDLVTLFTTAWNQQDKDQTPSPIKTIISHFQQDYVLGQQSAQAIYKAAATALNNPCKHYPVSSFSPRNLTPPPQFFLV